MNSLAAFMMNTLGSGAQRPAVVDTVLYGTLGTLDDTRYYFTNLLHQSPLDKTLVIHTFTDGVSHLADPAKRISYRISNDNGLNFGSKATLYDPTDGNFQVQDPSIGVDSNGRLHILADCHNGFTGGDTHEVRYMYSDDNGATLSSPVTIALPGGGLATFRFYGRMIQVDNVLMSPAYFFTEEGTFTNSARYVLRSTDFGANWNWILVESTTEYINESELLGINDDVVIMVSRQEASPKQFIMYKSEDKGATWFRCGLLSTTVIMSVANPCRLHKFFLDNGVEVAAMYFVDRANARLYGMYGKLENFIVGGVGGFNINTLTLLRQESVYLHYGDMVHYDGNLNAFGVWTREASTTPLVDNELIHFTNMTTHYGTLLDVLTPVTIYDHLAAPLGIYSWRGLATNNTNDNGTVNSSGQVTLFKSLRPGPTNVNFSATAGGIILGDGLEFDGTKVLTHSTALTFNPLSQSAAGYTDVHWTIHACWKAGTGSNPDAAYSLFGNNGASSSNIGLAIYYDDRASQSINNGLKIFITRGGGTFIINLAAAGIITPNAYFILTIETALVEAVQDDKVKVYINGVLQSTTVSTFNTTVATPPTYGAQIGGVGNNVLPLTGGIKHVIIQNTIDIDSVRDEIINTLMTLEGL